jgi:hypothetical protein
MGTKMTNLIERLLISIKILLLYLVMTIFKKDFIKKKLFNLSFFNIPILANNSSQDRLRKCLEYSMYKPDFTLEEKSQLALIKKYGFPVKPKKWKSPVDYPLKADRATLMARREFEVGHYDKKNFPLNYNKFKWSKRRSFDFTYDYDLMLEANKKSGLSENVAKKIFLKNYRVGKKKALLKWRADILEENNWEEKDFNEALFRARAHLDLKKRIQSAEIINNFVKKHKISKKKNIDLSYASLPEKKRLKRKEDWLHYTEINAKKDYTKKELRLKLHEEIPWSTFSDKDLPKYINTRKGMLKQSDILGLYPKHEWGYVKLPKKLLKKFKNSSYSQWKIDQIFPDRRSRHYNYYTSETLPWWRFKYDLDGTVESNYTIRTADFYTWFEVYNMISVAFDQYATAVPIILTLLCTHWIFVEALLCKFKCQQHYHINNFLLGTGFLIIAYWFFSITEAPFGLYKYGIFATSEWPLYFVIVKWIFFLLAYLFILIVFLIFAPKSPFLRSKTNMQLQHYIFFFIPCLIGILFSFIIIPKRLPFAEIVQNILLRDPDKIQFHDGYIYLFFILLFIAFTAVLFFYIIVSLKYFMLYYKSKNKKYLNSIESFLFSGREDESDLIDYDGKITPTKLPIELVPTTEDWDAEFYEVPDGYIYIFRDIYNYIHIWVGSYSKLFFLYWYLSTFFYGLFISYLYTHIELPSLLFFVFFVFCFLLFFYTGFLFKYFHHLKGPTQVRHLLIFLMLGCFLLFMMILFYNDAFYIFGL